MFKNWQKLVSTEKIIVLFLRISLLHEISFLILKDTSVFVNHSQPFE